MLAGNGRILLVRHGESEGNATRTFTASTEVPLTDLGRAQARRAAELIAATFAPIRVVSSPYARARQTGEIIASQLSLPLDIEGDFHEQWLGELRGQPYDLVAQDPTFDRSRSWEWRPPGGESLADVRRRVVPPFERLLRQHIGGDVILVSHGGVMRALWAHAIDSWENSQLSSNAAVVLIEHDGRRCSAPRLIDAGGSGKDAATLESGG